MSTVALRMKSPTSRYGLVVVRDVNGAFIRNHRITATELAELNASANGRPRGVTREEWTSGLARVLHVDLDTGDIENTSGGGLKLMYHVSQTPAGEEVRHLIYLAPGEWSGTPPNIAVNAATLDSALDPPSVDRRDPSPTRPTRIRISGGIATVTERP